jgi:hypothetical protein
MPRSLGNEAWRQGQNDNDTQPFHADLRSTLALFGAAIQGVDASEIVKYLTIVNRARQLDTWSSSVSGYCSEARQELRPTTENTAESLDDFRYDAVSGHAAREMSLEAT